MDVEIKGLVMVESNLFAFGAGVLLRGSLGFTVTVGGATAFYTRPHEVLFAGDTAAPNKCGNEQQRKKRTG